MPRFWTAICCVGMMVSVAEAASPYDPLVQALPPYVNTLMLINVKAAYSSPLAKREHWAEEYYQRYKSGTGFVPPDAEALVVGSYVNISTMTRDHQIGLVKVTGLPSSAVLASRESGTVSQVAGQPFVLSPRDVYFTTMPGLAAIVAVYPADRQASARWIKFATASKNIDLAPYLKNTVASAGKDVLTIVMDLSESQDATLLKLGLSASPVLVKQKWSDTGRVARFISTTQGLKFSVRMDEKITGTLRIDFTEDPAPLKKVLRELLLELLEDQGVTIPGLDQWQTTYTDTSMTLTGNLSTPDLRRIMSLFAFPGTSSSDSPPLKPGEVSQQSTQRYWSAVNTILADLRNLKDSSDYRKTATWHDKAAAQLDHLNRTGVDSLAVQVAQGASARLRAVAASLRGVPIDLDSLSRQTYYYESPSVGYSVGWWGRRIQPVWYGSGNVSTNYFQMRAEAEKVVTNDQKKRIETWNQIDQMVSEIRQRLTDKYKTPF